MLDMKYAMEKSEEFKEWEQEFYGASGASALSRLLERELVTPISAEEQEKEDFQMKVWRVADDIEYSKDFSDRVRTKGKTEIPVLLEEIQGLFEARGIKLFKVDEYVLIDNKCEEEDLLNRYIDDSHGDFVKDGKNTAVQFEVVLMNESDYPQSLWVKIPLMPVDLPVEPDF